MNIKNHGTWQPYKPDTLPKDAPLNTLFLRRADDGVDWYVYANSGKNFAEDSIKMTVIDGIVGAAAVDPTMIFPGNNATVLEISGVTVTDPQETFGSKVYDADRKTFSDRPPPEMPPGLDDILKRLEALENKK